MDGVKRRYESPRRRRQAEATQEQILASARRLLTSRGYAATTVGAIAEGAEVAPQTIYAVFGSKRAILTALIDTMEAEAELPALLEDLRAAHADPLRQLGLVVEFNQRLFSRGLDVLEILKGAGTAEPHLAAVWREGEQRRRQGQAPLVRGWAAQGSLRPGLGVKGAADILWTLTGPDVYRLLVVESGWSGKRYARWLRETLGSLLFGEQTS